PSDASRTMGWESHIRRRDWLQVGIWETSAHVREATDPTFVRLVERKDTVRISAVLNHQVGRQQRRPRAKPHRVARPFQSRPPWACDGISSPSRGLLPPLRFMILSKALKSARAFRSVK